jgi:hypothetical protein
MIQGVFSEIVKELMADADKAFSSGILGGGLVGVITKAISNAAGNLKTGGTGAAAKSAAGFSPAPAGIHDAAVAAMYPAATGALGGNAAGANLPNPVPILEQILQVTETIASLLHVSIRTTPGAPSGPDIRQRVRDMVTRGTWRGVVAPKSAAGPGYTNQIPGLATGATGNAAGGAGGIVGLARIAGVAGLVAGSLYAVYSAARAFVAGVMETNRDLAKYDGRLAASVARLEMTKLNLEIRQSQAVGPSGEMLNDEFGKLLEDIQPIREAVGIVATQFATGLVMLGRVGASVFSLRNLIISAIPLVGRQFADALDAADQKKKDDQGRLLNADLRNLRHLGAPAPANPVPGMQRPAFIPPLIRPPGVDGRGMGGRR